MKSTTKIRIFELGFHLLITLCIVFVGIIVRIKVIPLILNEDEYSLIRLVEYIIYYLALRVFVEAFKEWKHFNILYKIVSFPEHSYSLFIKPYLKILLGSVLFFFIFALLSLLLQFFPENIGYDWSYSTKAFIGISTSVMLLRAFGNTIIKWTFRWYYKKDNRKEQIDLTLSLINEQRIRYLIYLFFFVLLIWYTLIDLENPDILNHTNESKAVLSAFGVFIAFDRLIDKRTLIGFNPKRHAQKLLAVYDNDPHYTEKENYLVDLIRRKTSQEQSTE